MQKDAKYKRRLLLGIIGMLLFIFLSIGVMGVYAYKTIMPIYKEIQSNKANIAEFNKNIKLIAKYDEEKKYEEELAAAEKALSYAKNDISKSQAYYAIGNSYYFLDNPEKAEVNAKKSIKLDPNYSYAYDTIFRIEMDNKNYEKALEYAKKLVKVLPDEDIGYADLAVAYFYLGNKEESVKNIKKAIDIAPEKDEYKDYLKEYESTKPVSAAPTPTLNPRELDPNYWKTELGYMSDDEKNINKITGDSRYDQSKLARAKSMNAQRMNIINPIYSKLVAGQKLNGSDMAALDNYWAITDQYYALADEILHPK